MKFYTSRLRQSYVIIILILFCCCCKSEPKRNSKPTVNRKYKHAPRQNQKQNLNKDLIENKIKHTEKFFSLFWFDMNKDEYKYVIEKLKSQGIISNSKHTFETRYILSNGSVKLFPNWNNNKLQALRLLDIGGNYELYRQKYAFPKLISKSEDCNCYSKLNNLYDPFRKGSTTNTTKYPNSIRKFNYEQLPSNEVIFEQKNTVIKIVNRFNLEEVLNSYSKPKPTSRNSPLTSEMIGEMVNEEMKIERQYQYFCKIPVNRLDLAYLKKEDFYSEQDRKKQWEIERTKQFQQRKRRSLEDI